ncbi:MAG: phosphoribosylaminoimidazolesuccinocarboxamide synthase [Candidatus Hydrothermarchaeota archaeon]
MYEGKSKKIFFTEDPQLIKICFKDDITAFNRQKHDIIAGKGELNADISAYLFQLLESKEIKTHFIERHGKNCFIAKRLEMLPIEVVCRNIAMGSLLKRIPVERGQILDTPIIEFFYKNDELGDPLINEDHLVSMGILTWEEISFIKKVTIRINEILSDFFSKKSLTLVDFKLEFGKDEEGNIILGDEISPDTCRIWDSQTKEILDKDRFRLGRDDVLEGYKEIYARIMG